MPPEPDLIFAPFAWTCRMRTCGAARSRCPCSPGPLPCCTIWRCTRHRLVTQAEVLQAVWGDTSVSEGLLRGYIRDLRAALGDEATEVRVAPCGTLAVAGHLTSMPVY